MPKNLAADRRQHPRAPLAGRLHALTFQAPSSPRILDLSESGARLELDQPFPAGQQLELTMTLVDRHGRPQSCSVCSDIVRSEGREIGIRFRRLLPLHLLQLRDYVWRHQPGRAGGAAVFASRPGRRSRRWLSLFG